MKSILDYSEFNLNLLSRSLSRLANGERQRPRRQANCSHVLLQLRPDDLVWKQHGNNRGRLGVFEANDNASEVGASRYA